MAGDETALKFPPFFVGSKATVEVDMLAVDPVAGLEHSPEGSPDGRLKLALDRSFLASLEEHPVGPEVVVVGGRGSCGAVAQSVHHKQGWWALRKASAARSSDGAVVGRSRAGAGSAVAAANTGADRGTSLEAVGHSRVALGAEVGWGRPGQGMACHQVLKWVVDELF